MSNFITRCHTCGARTEFYTDGLSGLVHERQIPCVCTAESKERRRKAELARKFQKGPSGRKCACGADISHRPGQTERCLACSSSNSAQKRRKEAAR